MISRHTSAALVSLVCGLLTVGCASKPESSPESFDFDEPTSADTSNRASDTSSSGDAAAPRRFEAGHFDWAPDDTPVVLHTVEESHATKEEWKAFRQIAPSDHLRARLGVSDEFYKNNPDIGFVFGTYYDDTYYDDPRNPRFQGMPIADSIRNPSGTMFLGLGLPPLPGEAWHLFECYSEATVSFPSGKTEGLWAPASVTPHWRVGEFVVTCHEDELYYMVIEDEDGVRYPKGHWSRTLGGEEGEETYTYTNLDAIGPLPATFASWLERVVEYTLEYSAAVIHEVEDRVGDSVEVPMIAYDPIEDIGGSAPQYVRVNAPVQVEDDLTFRRTPNHFDIRRWLEFEPVNDRSSK
jgi:hypothetical protein